MLHICDNYLKQYIYEKIILTNACGVRSHWVQTPQAEIQPRKRRICCCIFSQRKISILTHPA
jgi:hypothetical protein